MATTYDKASLVMIPSGVKEDKLYSIKPTDGSGDFTFSRGSDIEATRVNSSGLIEKAKVNLLTYSNDFSNGDWSKANSAVTGGQSGYDGSSDAWKLEIATAGSASVRQSNSASGLGTYSIYAKAGNVNWAHMYFLSSGADFSAFFNLSNGSIGSSTSTIDATIEQVGSTDWYRISITGIDADTQVRIYVASADGTNATTAGDYIYIQDAQLNYGLVAQDYVETTSSSVVEGLTADLPRLDYSGGASCPSLLLEPQRGNILLHSEYFNYWSVSNLTATANSIDSPEGVQNAYLITSTGSGNHPIYRGTSCANGTYTMSVFLKKGAVTGYASWEDGYSTTGIQVNLNDEIVTPRNANSLNPFIESFSDGWYRVGYTLSNTSGIIQPALYLQDANGNTNHTAAGETIYMYGAQLEAGSYPTSYIPTYSTAATRLYEYPLVNPQNILGATEGSWFVNFADMSFDVSGTSGPSVYIGYNQSNYLGITNRSLGNVTQVLFCKRESGSITNLHTILSQSGNDKFCFTWNGSSLKLFVNGTKVYDDNSFANFIAWDELILGNTTRTPQYNNKQTLLFPTQLTDAEAIALTE